MVDKFGTYWLRIFKRVHWIADKFGQIGDMSGWRLVASGALKCQYEAAGIRPRQIQPAWLRFSRTIQLKSIFILLNKFDFKIGLVKRGFPL